jgi:hypothetical protein
MESHTVGQAPAVTGGGFFTGPGQSQVAAVAVQVLVLLYLKVPAGSFWSQVDRKEGLTYLLATCPEAPSSLSASTRS